MIDRTSPNYCPEHGIVYRCRKDDTLICLVYECGWNTPARRKEDKAIPTAGELRAKEA